MTAKPLGIALRHKKITLLASLCLLLASCTLIMGPQAALINSLFEKFVGVSPLDAKIFEHPLIKGRMQDLLGDYYEPTMKLLNTASAIQKEGPIYYVISRYTPLPEFADKAGFAYNSETNQMVVLLLKGDVHKVLYETVDKAAKKVMPPLPKEMDLLIHPEKALDTAIDKAKDAAVGAAAETLSVDPAMVDTLKNADPATLQQKAAEALQQQANPQAAPAAAPAAPATTP